MAGLRVLVTGAGGQLGKEVAAAFSFSPTVEVAAFDRSALDVSDRDQCLQVIGAVQPHAVVHAAAYTDVDGCETNPDQAYAVNSLGTRNVAEAARLAGARVCYVSSDYVFDGRGSRPYTEWDATGPLSAYGRSKLGGEAALGPDDTIVRTSWVCGRHGRNFVKTILGRALAGDTLTVVDDQHGCPTFADDLAQMIRTLVVARRSGLFHVTNQGATTWFQFARDIVSAAGLDPALISPIPTTALQPARPAPRPAYSVLDNAALRLSGTALLDDHHEPLGRLVKELTS